MACTILGEDGRYPTYRVCTVSVLLRTVLTLEAGFGQPPTRAANSNDTDIYVGGLAPT
jgi:hypothetical protein